MAEILEHSQDSKTVVIFKSCETNIENLNDVYFFKLSCESSSFVLICRRGGTAMHFEEVRSGGKQMEDPSKKKLNLQLDNKFGALQAD